MLVAGRHREMEEVGRLLDRARAGAGGLAGALVLRDGPGDADRASEHRRRAWEIAAGIGMTVLLNTWLPRPTSGR